MNKTRYHLRSDLFASGTRRARPSVAGPAQGTGTAPRALTEQERRVVAELARGSSNRQIARALELSEHTIKFHLKNVFNKLGVRSRTQVIVHATSASSSAAVPAPQSAAFPFAAVAAASARAVIAP